MQLQTPHAITSSEWCFRACIVPMTAVTPDSDQLIWRRTRSLTLIVCFYLDSILVMPLILVALANILKANPGTAFAIIIEPEAVSTIVLNSDLASCKPLKDSYNVNAIYALKTLSLPNTVLYLDAGHGGTLGWESNLKPGADYLASIVKGAGSPSQVRGFSVNVAGWNSW